MIAPKDIHKIAKQYTDVNSRFMMVLKNEAATDVLDIQFRDLHNEIFIRDAYDCCKCANCCKRYDIRVEQTDIPAIAAHLGQTESAFIGQYLTKDDEEPGVFHIKDKPCSFLDTTGKCRIYEVRPLVCREFPHTNKAGRLYHLAGMFDFAEDCHVVFEIIEQLKRMYG